MDEAKEASLVPFAIELGKIDGRQTNMEKQLESILARQDYAVTQWSRAMGEHDTNDDRRFKEVDDKIYSLVWKLALIYGGLAVMSALLSSGVVVYLLKP